MTPPGFCPAAVRSPLSPLGGRGEHGAVLGLRFGVIGYRLRLPRLPHGIVD